MRLTITYTILALIATIMNIATQDILIRSYHGQSAMAFSITAGTAAGLITKYILDKRFIFRFKARDRRHEGRTFVLYLCMGVFTTLIFWGVELLFHYLFHVKELRYLGGIIGLAIGYIIKYHLDKRFVFTSGSDQRWP